MIRVLIVDDQRMSRENMEKIVQSSGRYLLAASVTSADVALTVCMQQPIDMILMDVYTQGHRDGIDATVQIREKFPAIRIIIVTSMPEASYLERAKKAGADSFWYKETSQEELIDVMDRTWKGEHIFPDRSPVVRLGQTTSADLTEGEIRVLRQVMEGLEYDEIAGKLGVSTRTVQFHISNILSKTGYANKTLLVIAVAKKQFIIPELDEEE